MRWYVPRALGEETAISNRRLPAFRGALVRAPLAAALAGLAIVASACGGDKQRQDANEPEGDFPVAVQSAKFPTDQRLAQTRDLQLEIENTGNKTVPNLAVTDLHRRREGRRIVLGAKRPAGALQPQPTRVDPRERLPEAARARRGHRRAGLRPPGGASAAQTDTFAFGPLESGESKDLVWRVTPVVGGTYTVHYELAAGLTGKARAVGEDGSPVKGEFVVTISDKPPRAGVDDNGDVTIETQ